MSTIPIKSTVTPDELLNLPDAGDYELVEGNLVERHMGSESSAVAVAIAIIIGNHIRPQQLGHLFTTDCGYQCFPDDPNKVRKPDVSFIQRGRLPDNRPPEGYIRIAPDLAVEVLSPGDLAYEIEQKVSEYLKAGVKLIWVANPKTRTVRIHRAPGSAAGPISFLGESDSISGEEVLPGFECRVSELFEI